MAGWNKFHTPGWDRFYFDEERVRDPVDRATVDEIRCYAKEYGATVREFEWEGADAPGNANFAVGWEGDLATLFVCVKGDIIVPLDMLGKLKHLNMLWIVPYYRDLSWTGKLEGLTHISIFYMPAGEECFPNSWHSVATLQKLTLRYFFGSMAYLPESIRKLGELREITLTNTSESRAINIPDWLGDFPKLQKLYLQGNFTTIPYSVVAKGLPFTADKDAKRGVILNDVMLAEQDVSMFLNNDRTLIEAYYQGEQTGEDTTIRECKVIFLGDGGAGKTSLIKRIMQKPFRLGESTTEGVRIISWNTELDGKPFRLRFMDFGGQEIMHSMHRCFLSNHTVYVVVCSLRDDIERKAAVVRWLEQVKSYAPDCPVILALNKADENPRISVDETSLTERYPALKKVLKTSAAAEQGNPFFAEFLYDAIMEQVPSCVQDWRGNKGMLDVKRALETMKENYITAEEYRKICGDKGVKDEDVQNSLLGWFRDLGVAYFYKRKAYDGALENLRVLNPEWLTNGIYRLILRTDAQGKNGVLSHDDIRGILGKPFEGDASDTIYNAEETEFLLHVMRIFQISHEIQDTGKELIPMLMPEKTPRIAKKYKKDALHLRWEGAFLPNNLIHRLMIRKFEELDFRCMWRVGAWFKAPHGSCIALAEMLDDKSLDVYVSGRSADERREYMRSFQDKVTEILKSLNLSEATKKYLCCTVNGKDGKILYEDLLFMWGHGDNMIPIPGIQEYVSPTELLHMVDPDPKHWKPPTLPAHPDAPTEKESAETWNINLKNILLAFAIIIILILLSKGADLLELLKILLGSE